MAQPLNRLTNQYSTFTFATAKRFGVTQAMLQKAERHGDLRRTERGVFVVTGFQSDAFSLLSQRFSLGVLSGTTARQFYDLSDELPAYYEMTFPRGYHNPSLARHHVRPRYQISQRYQLGIEDAPTLTGNPVRVYSIERTVLETWEDKNVDVEVRQQTVQEFIRRYGQDYHRLAEVVRLAAVLYPNTGLIATLEVLT